MAVDGKNRNAMENLVNSWSRGSLIGQGAFGKVNLALNKENGELFAVKSIDWCEESERMSGEMKAMENEVEILQSLKNSPFIVNYLGSSLSVENGNSMRNVFMEYMPGGSVADLMKKFGGLGFGEALIRKYTRGILEGIRYLHEEGIVHCDIKGRNVLVGSTGVVKLADFGGARRLGLDGAREANSDAVLTVDSDLLLNVKGTPLWMAPEVVRQVEQGPASDVWSLGCTVVEMATGKAPWSDIVGSDPFVALYHIGCTEEVPDLPSCLSEQGQDFLSKCFQRDPRVRWTAAQLLEHPFVTDTFVSIQSNESTDFSFQSQEKIASPASASDFATNKPTIAAPLLLSPTSVFDFSSTSSSALTDESTTSMISVPILRSPLQFFPKRFPQQQQQQQQGSNFFQTEDVQQKESATTSSPSTPSASGSDFWCNSPLSDFGGQWITVRTPKTVSPSSSSSRVSSFAASELIANSSVEDESASPEVQDEIPEVVASCSTLTEEGVRVTEEEDNEQKRDESLEITAEQASCSSSSSSAAQEGSSCSNTNSDQNAEEDLSITQCDNSSKVYCQRTLAVAAVDDLRCVDTRGIPKPNSASWRATLRKLRIASARRKLSFRVRSRLKPRRQRSPVCRELHDFLRQKLWRSLYSSFHSLSFGTTLRSQEQICNDSFGGSLQPSFFRNRELHQFLYRRLTSLGRYLNSLTFRETILSHHQISEDSFVVALSAILQLSFFGDIHGAELQPSFFTNRLFLNKGASVAASTTRKVSMNVPLNFLALLTCIYQGFSGWSESDLRATFLFVFLSELIVQGFLNEFSIYDPKISPNNGLVHLAWAINLNVKAAFNVNPLM